MLQRRRKRARELSMHEKIAVCELRCKGMTIKQIATAQSHTERQVQHALQTPSTPRDKSRLQHRAVILKRIKAFLAKDPRHRLIPWRDLGRFIEGCERWRGSYMRNVMKSDAYLNTKLDEDSEESRS
jgi:DNA-binding transcriptional MerR regulator